MPFSYPEFFIIIIIIAFRAKTIIYPTLLKEINPLDGIGNILGNSNAPFIPRFFIIIIIIAFRARTRNYPTLLKETNPLDGIGNILGNSNAPFLPIFF